MTIPFQTTTISVLRVAADAERDPYDAQPAASTVASGVRAVISTGSGREAIVGGEQSVITHRLSCDTVDLTHTDTVQDAEGNEYQVVWVSQRLGFGMDHTQAGLKVVTGIAAGAA